LKQVHAHSHLHNMVIFSQTIWLQFVCTWFCQFSHGYFIFVQWDFIFAEVSLLCRNHL
jgi:hypothetical protein